MTNSTLQDQWTDPLFPLSSGDAVGTVCAFLTVMAASVGGIGGGGLLVPLYMLALGLGRFAIPLSKATICGGAISNVAIQCRRRHPLAEDRPLIAYDVAAIFEPLTLAGTVIGVLLNSILPEWLVTVLLVALLSYTARKTLIKGRAMWLKESRRKSVEERLPKSVIVATAAWVNPAHEAADARGSEPGRRVSAADFYVMEENSVTVQDTGDDEGEAAPEAAARRATSRAASGVSKAGHGLATTVIEESGPSSGGEGTLTLIWSLVLAWTFVLFTALLKGGHGADPLLFAVPCGGVRYWALTLLSVLGMVGMTALVGCRLSSMQKRKAATGHKPLKGEIVWEGSQLVVLPAFCVVAGVAAGLLGIGGGMVTGPLLLALGVNPAVAAATSGFMVLFTSSSTTIQFLVAGMLRADYAIWYGGVGVLATVVGQSFAGWYIRVYGRQSVVVLTLGIVIGLSGVVTGLAGSFSVAADYRDKDWDAFGLHELC